MPGGELNGFLALAEYDKASRGGNGDGKIDRADAVFGSLMLWQDEDHNQYFFGLRKLTHKNHIVSARIATAPAGVPDPLCIADASVA